MTYIRSIYVYNNFVDKNFEIDFSPVNGEPFRHLILTGNNGSGKTNTLNAINLEFQKLFNGFRQPQIYFTLKSIRNELDVDIDMRKFSRDIPRTEIDFLIDYKQAQTQIPHQVYEYFGVTRHAEIDDASGFRVPLKRVITSKNPGAIDPHANEIQRRIETCLNLIKGDPQNKLTEETLVNIQTELDEHCHSGWFSPSRTFLSRYFLNYLLLKKRQQAYAIADNEVAQADRLTKWFSWLEENFQDMFEEPQLRLKHRFSERRFYFEYPSGRQLTFDHLADGHDSILAIVTEIMLHNEAYQSETAQLEPSGIILIDEIENHLHISLQEKILPFLTKMFPHIQFIVTTHSPIVMASIENATVYDLSTHEKSDENLTGMEYGVLMREYLGIETVYSLLATEKLKEAKRLLNKSERSDTENKRLEELSTELGALSEDLALDVYLEIERLRRRSTVT
ncbi:MAG: AAA family ATPase [Candidatus Promineifilaceae bacterium]